MNFFRLVKQIGNLYKLRAVHLTCLGIGARGFRPNYFSRLQQRNTPPKFPLSSAFEQGRGLGSFQIRSLMTEPTSSSSTKDADSLWKSYEEAMKSILSAFPEGKKPAKKVSIEAFIHVQEFLLSESSYRHDPLVEASKSEKKDLRQLLTDRKSEFLTKNNFSNPQDDLASRCLVNLVSQSAKKQEVAPVVVAWQKIKDSGTALKPNFLSSLIYVLGLDEDYLDISLEVATFHDMLYGATENSIFLRTKALIAMGDPSGAEALLEQLPETDEDCKRLRTFSPILKYYCDAGDAYSILRVWKQICEAPGAYIDSATYSLILRSLAKCNVFNVGAERIEGIEKLGMSGVGPTLLDEILNSMREDLVEISEESAIMLYNEFQSAFGTTDQTGQTEVPPCSQVNSEKSCLFAGRTTIERSTARCTQTGATLQLFTLTQDQRQHLNTTLLEMAATQQMEFESGKKAEAKYKNGNYARNELLKFGQWLENRDGAPFTAFVDGANVAYFGHGNVHYSQVLQVVKALERLGERPLVIMPQKYVNASFRLGHGVTQELTPQCLETLKKLISEGKMYVVPARCFDDYYWMYASISKQKGGDDIEAPAANSALMPGIRPILVSNDQMRDHKLSLLEPLLFRRWYSSHVTTYSFLPYKESEWEEREVDFSPADSFSSEIQGNAINKEGFQGMAWHFPVSEWEARTERFCLAIATRD